MGQYHKLSAEQIQSILEEITDPYTGQSLLANKALQTLEITDERLSLVLEKSYPTELVQPQLLELIASTLQKHFGENAISEDSIQLTVKSNITAHSMQQTAQTVDNVKNIIAVASGKGGVGKSTVTANLALSLAKQGARVGVLDADIYGPSQPKMMGLSGKPEMVGNQMIPLNNYELQVMSIGFMIDDETPVIWRGPMVTQALEQMLRQSKWDSLDYLFIDLPPGTGDIQLTLAQKIPIAGAVIVSTPQDMSLIDARKAVKMFEKVEVPLLGVIENMSTHICSNCQHEEAIFGTGGGQTMADEYKLPFLGSIPLEMGIRQNADAGKPTVVAEPESATTQRYHEIALFTAGRLAARKKNYKSLFPNIEISNT
ncbi:MAG: iron-sulfur cluster carrier protein ApbC [Arenicella sp.]